MDSLTKQILDWCRSHPDDPDSQYFTKGIHESLMKKNEERNRWRLLATGLEYYEYRRKDNHN